MDFISELKYKFFMGFIIYFILGIGVDVFDFNINNSIGLLLFGFSIVCLIITIIIKRIEKDWRDFKKMTKINKVN